MAAARYRPQIVSRASEVAAREAGVRSASACRSGKDAESRAGARALYERSGYVFAHGPFVQAALLLGDGGARMPVASVCVYLVKTL